jgi:type II secretory pathway pseudopilin PulG
MIEADSEYPEKLRRQSMRIQRDRAKRRGGFTAIETLVAMGVMAVLGTAVVGDWVGSQSRQGLEQARLQLLGDLRAARMTAVTRGLDVQVTFRDELNQYTVWADANQDGVMDAGEFETKVLDATHEISLWSYPSQGTFRPTGAFSSGQNFGYLSLSGPDGYHALHLTPLGHVGEITQSAHGYDTGDPEEETL